jgi:general secretion pathway protein G
VGHRGVTLIELLITITILAILASIIVPLSQITVKRQKELELRRNLRIIRTAIDEYKKAWDEKRILKKVGESGYPPDLTILVEGVDDAKSPEFGKEIRFLRSYDSDPDNPKKGRDVFDVYSQSEEIAIDGTPYESW